MTETFIDLVRRRADDRDLQNAIRSYDMNRRAEPTRKQVALKCVEETLGRDK